MANLKDFFQSSSVGSVPVGGTIMFPDHYPVEFETDEQLYLRSGFETTDPAKFDSEAFTTPKFPLGKSIVTPGGAGQMLIYSFANGKHYRGVSNYNKLQVRDGDAWVDVGGIVATRSLTRVAGIPGLLLVGDRWAGGAVQKYWTSTDDGASWTERNSPWSLIYLANNTNFPNGSPVQVLDSFKGRIYVYAMRNGTETAGEIYSTTDGTTWRKENIPLANFHNGSFSATDSNANVLTVSVASSVSGENRSYVLVTTDGVTWAARAALPPNFNLSLVNADHALGYIDGKFQFAAKSGAEHPTNPNTIALLKTADFSSWEIEFTPSNNAYFTGSKSIDGTPGDGEAFNNPINLWETVGYQAGYYWLSTTYEPGMLYVSKDFKAWMKRQISTLTDYWPSAPKMRIGNKLLFGFSGGYNNIGQVAEFEIDFDQTKIVAGSPILYQEGSMVQYMRTK